MEETAAWTAIASTLPAAKSNEASSTDNPGSPEMAKGERGHSFPTAFDWIIDESRRELQVDWKECLPITEHDRSPARALAVAALHLAQRTFDVHLHRTFTS